MPDSVSAILNEIQIRVTGADQAASELRRVGAASTDTAAQVQASGGRIDGTLSAVDSAVARMTASFDSGMARIEGAVSGLEGSLGAADIAVQGFGDRLDGLNTPLTEARMGLKDVGTESFDTANALGSLTGRASETATRMSGSLKGVGDSARGMSSGFRESKDEIGTTLTETQSRIESWVSAVQRQEEKTALTWQTTTGDIVRSENERRAAIDGTAARVGISVSAMNDAAIRQVEAWQAAKDSLVKDQTEIQTSMERTATVASDTATKVDAAAGREAAGGTAAVSGSSGGFGAGSLKSSGRESMMAGAGLLALPLGALYEAGKFYSQGQATAGNINLNPAQTKSMDAEVLKLTAAGDIASKDIFASFLHSISEFPKATAPQLRAIIESAWKSAIGSSGSEETITNALVKAAHNWKLDPSQVPLAMDLIHSIGSFGNLTVEQLSQNMSKSSQAAASSGMSMATYGGLYDTLSRQFKAPQVDTYLASLLQKIMSPTPGAQKEIDALGLKGVVSKSGLEKYGIFQVIKDLEDATAGPNQQQLLSKIMPARMGGLALTGLSRFLPEAEKTTEKLGGSIGAETGSAVGTGGQVGGITDKMFERMEQQLSFQTKKMVNDVRVMAVEIGAALIPAASSVFKSMEPIVRVFGDFLKVHPGVVKAAVEIGGALLAIGALSWVAGALLAFNPVIAIIGGLAVAFLLAYNNSKPFHDMVDSLAHQVLPVLKAALSDVQSILQRAGSWLSQFATDFARAFEKSPEYAGFLRQVGQALGQIGNAIQPVLRDLSDFTGASKGGGDSAQKWASILNDILRPAAVLMGTSFKMSADVIVAAIHLVSDTIRLFADAAKGIFTILGDEITLLSDLIHGHWGKIAADTQKLKNDVVGLITALKNDVVRLFGDLWADLSRVVSDLVTGVVHVFQTLYNELVGHSIIPDLITAIVAFFTGLPGRLAGALASLLSTVLGAFKTLASDLASWASSLGGKFLGWATGWGSKIASGITSEAGKIKDALVGAVQGAANAAGDWLSHHNPLDFLSGSGKTAPSGTGGDRPSATLFGMPATSISPGPAYASGVPGGVLHEDFQSRVGAPFYLPGGKGANYQLVGLTRSGVGWTETWRTPNGGEFDFMHMASIPSGMHAGENEHGGYRAGTSGGRPGIDVPDPAYSTGPHLHFGANQAALNYIYRETGPRGWVPGPMTAPYGQAGVPAFSQFSGGGSGVPASIGQYDVLIRAAAKKYGIDPAILEALIMQESSGNRKAVSSAGAQGLTQIMPSNDRHLGITNPFDPKQSIMGGAKLLAEYLNGPAHGNLTTALAMYNAGPGNARAGMGYASQVEQRAAGYGPDLTQRGGAQMSASTAADANRAARAPIPVPPEFSAIGKDFTAAATLISKLPSDLQAGPMASLKKTEGEWSADLATYSTKYQAENVRHALATDAIRSKANEQERHFLADHNIHLSGSLEKHAAAVQKVIDAEPIERKKEVDHLNAVHQAFLTKYDSISGSNAAERKRALEKHETGVEAKLKDHINGLSGATARHITSLDKSFGISNSTQAKLLNEWLRNHKAVLDTALSKEDALHGKHIAGLKTTLDSHISGLRAEIAKIQAAMSPSALWTKFASDLAKSVKDATATMSYTAVFGKDQVTTTHSAGTSRGAPTPQVFTTGDLTGQRGSDTKSTRTVVPTDLTAQRPGDVNAAVGSMIDKVTTTVVTVAQQVWSQAAQGAVARAKADAASMVQGVMGGIVSLVDGKLSDFGNSLGAVTTFLTSQFLAGLMAGKPANDAYIATMAQVVQAQRDVASISTAVSAKIAIAGDSFSGMASAAGVFLTDVTSRWQDDLTRSGSAANAWTDDVRKSAQASRSFTDAQNHQSVMLGQITNSYSTMSNGLQGLFSSADDDLKLFTANTGRASNGLYIAGGDVTTFGDKIIATSNNLGSLGDIISGLAGGTSDLKSQAETEFARTGSISQATLSEYGKSTGALSKATWDQVAADLILYRSTGDLKNYQSTLGTEIGLQSDKVAELSKQYGVQDARVIAAQATLKSLQDQSSALGDEQKILAGDTSLSADATAKATTAYQSFIGNGIDPAETAAAAWGGVIAAGTNDQTAYNQSVTAGKSAVDQLSGSFLGLIPEVKSLASSITDAVSAIARAILNVNAASSGSSGSSTGTAGASGGGSIGSVTGQTGGVSQGGGSLGLPAAQLPSYQGIRINQPGSFPGGYVWDASSGKMVWVPAGATPPTSSPTAAPTTSPPAPSTATTATDQGTWTALPGSTASAYVLNNTIYLKGSTLPNGDIVGNGVLLVPGTYAYYSVTTQTAPVATPPQPTSNALISSSLSQSAGEGSTFTGWSTGSAGASVYYLNGTRYPIGSTLPDGTVVGANQQLLPQGSSAGNAPVSNRTWSSLGFNNSPQANSMLGQYGISSSSFWGLSLDQQRQQLISHGILGGPGGVTAGPFAPRPPATPGTGTATGTGSTAGTSATDAATIAALTFQNKTYRDTIMHNNLGLLAGDVSKGGFLGVLNSLGGRLSTPGAGWSVSPGWTNPPSTATQSTDTLLLKIVALLTTIVGQGNQALSSTQQAELAADVQDLTQTLAFQRIVA